MQNDDTNTCKILRSAMLCAVGERDFSAQETSHMLLSLPLVNCTFNFVTVSLDGSRKLSESEESGELILQDSVRDQYATRDHSISALNFSQFVANYHVVHGEVVKRSVPIIVRTFPSFSSNPQGENYNLYCKYQLIKYQPWTGNPFNALQSGLEEIDDYVTAYSDFLQTDIGKQCIPDFVKELDQAQKYRSQNDSESESEDTDYTEVQHSREDWMICCRLNQLYTMETTSNLDSIDWPAYARTLLLKESPSWVKLCRKISEEDPSRSWHRQLSPVDISTLNYEQHLAYDIIKNHHMQLDANQNPPPLHMIVCGTAGTGKSYLINAISQALGDVCTLTGTTGIASYNICGKTLHSTLQLPINMSRQQDLKGSALQRLQLTMKKKQYILIDEMSMMGQKMFSWVDRRLRQATGKLEQPFGGISVIMFGDFAQLPPVCDIPLYAPISSNTAALHGYTIYLTFTTVVILKQILRQYGTDPSVQAFREMLLRLRDGIICHNDWQMLLQHSSLQVENSDFVDAIRLFYDRESVMKFNHDKLRMLGKPIALIKAIHSNITAANVKSDDAGGLHPIIFIAKGAHVMLTANLWPEVGLCNGASGIVHELLYQEGQAPPNLPISVLVAFDNYSGPAFLNEFPNCVPIPPITFE